MLCNSDPKSKDLFGKVGRGGLFKGVSRSAVFVGCFPDLQFLWDAGCRCISWGFCHWSATTIIATVDGEGVLKLLVEMWNQSTRIHHGHATSRQDRLKCSSYQPTSQLSGRAEVDQPQALKTKNTHKKSTHRSGRIMAIVLAVCGLVSYFNPICTYIDIYYIIHYHICVYLYKEKNCIRIYHFGCQLNNTHKEVSLIVGLGWQSWIESTWGCHDAI